jgi:hypothetical protein
VVKSAVNKFLLTYYLRALFSSSRSLTIDLRVSNSDFRLMRNLKALSLFCRSLYIRLFICCTCKKCLTTALFYLEKNIPPFLFGLLWLCALLAATFWLDRSNGFLLLVLDRLDHVVVLTLNNPIERRNKVN